MSACFDVTDLDVCQDCILFLSNGQCEGCESCVFADDPDTAPCRTVAARMVEVWGEDARHMVPACDDECDGGFSWSQCDGCGSWLGGDRHRAAILRPVTA